MNILRWILVLPAAVLAHTAVQLIGGTVVGGAIGLLGTSIRESSVANWLGMLIYYVVSEFAFVIAGAKTAPRRQATTAVTLTILGIGLSLMKHVVGQHVAGNRVGTTNYLHAGLEIAGLLAGTAFILVSMRKRRLSSPNTR